MITRKKLIMTDVFWQETIENLLYDASNKQNKKSHEEAAKWVVELKNELIKMCKENES